MKILLAEDNKINAKVTTLFLSKMGHFVELAVNGKEVLHALEHGDFDIVLMDLEMPELSGTEAISIIREGKHDGIDAQIPIYALSAHSADEIKELYPDLSITGYLTKPVDKNKLADLLDSIDVTA